MDKGIEDGRSRFQTSRKPPVKPPISPNLFLKCTPESGCGKFEGVTKEIMLY